MSKIRVMIIDDDYYVREGLKIFLRRSPKTALCQATSKPAEALNLLKTTKKDKLPDLILMDVMFENTNQNGIDFIEGIRAIMPEVKILMSSMSKNEELILKAINNGADGYVWKNESGDGVISAIEKTHQGRFVVTKSIAERIIGKAIELRDYSVEILSDRKKYRDLSEELRKTMYLYCFCGMSSKEIADELNLSAHTINSRIKTAYQILQATNKTEAFEKLAERWE